jgi:alginate O-acetyltransferase complex protein AlgI
VIFVSYWFIVFALIYFPLFWLVRKPRLRLLLLIAGCATFHYHFAGPAGVIPIIVLAALTYLIALTRRSVLCSLGIAMCAVALIFYKYTHFLSIQVVSLASPSAGAAIQSSLATMLPAAPPLGISFFAFEFVHYLFEVRRGGAPITNPLHFAAFSVFWPSLVAGPIKRYQQFVPQLAKGACPSSPDVTIGLMRIASGLLKKGMADNLTIWIDYQANQFALLDLQWRWLFFVLLALRIYFDFSGYSDMAIGFARMMGIRLPENFNWPYISASITEFWQRWHISLSSWIRDYIYIPIGGSRHGVPRKIANGLIAFAICGLWHGADWNFLAWGIYHGLGLAINGNYERYGGLPGRAVAGLMGRVRPLSMVMTFLFVGFGWLMFFYPLPRALHMARLLFERGAS